MTELSAQSDKLRGLLRALAGWAMVALLGLNMSGCNLLKSTPRPARTPAPAASVPAQPISTPAATATALDPCALQQREIERLQQLLTEKEALIRSQQVRQREPSKVMQEITKQTSRIQVKLRRATPQSSATLQSSTAAAIAEVETAMKNLQSSPATAPEQALLVQAQRLFDAATASYAKGDYATAMDHVAQSREFIDTLTAARAAR